MKQQGFFFIWVLMFLLLVLMRIVMYMVNLNFFVWSRYTCFAGLFPLLSKGTLPLLTVEEISQIIDSENVTVENIVLLAGPLATTSIGNSAKFEVRSPKSVQVLFSFLLMLSFLIND